MLFRSDVGVRNALIGDFRAPEIRQDKGALWENFIISERIKRNSYKRNHVIQFFWRTYTGAELDYIEEGDGKLSGFEIKWGDKVAKVPQSWTDNYSDAGFKTVNMENYLEFIAE